MPRHGATRVALVLVVLAATVSGCSSSGGTLGGREKCWSASDARAPSLWRGILAIDGDGARLNTPESEVIVLLPGVLATRVGKAGVGHLVRGSDVVARAGDDVTLFGGIGADRTMIVCGLEEIHAR